jgi:hypothetical protein
VIDGTATLDAATTVTGGNASTLNGTIAVAPGATVVHRWRCAASSPRCRSR